MRKVPIQRQTSQLSKRNPCLDQSLNFASLRRACAQSRDFLAMASSRDCQIWRLAEWGRIDCPKRQEAGEMIS